MDNFTSWDDIGFDPSTTFSLANKDEDPVILSKKMAEIITSQNPVQLGLFDDEKETNAPTLNVTALYNCVDDDSDSNEPINPANSNLEIQELSRLASINIPDDKTITKSSPPLENASSSAINRAIHTSGSQLSSLEQAAIAFEFQTARLSSTATISITKPSLGHSHSFGFRTPTNYIIASRDELLFKVRSVVINISELCYLTETEAESLLRRYQWEVTKLQNDWISDRLQTRLNNGVWRQFDTNCYIFGIGCLSNFLTTSSLITYNNFAKASHNAQNKTQAISWNEIIQELYHFYNIQYFSKSPRSLTNNISPSTNESISRKEDTIIIPNTDMGHDFDNDGVLSNEANEMLQYDSSKVENSVFLNRHSTSLLDDLRGSYRFMEDPVRNNRARNSSFNHNGELGTSLSRLSFSKLDVSYRDLINNILKDEVSSILTSLLQFYHFPQPIDLAAEHRRLQQQFIQYHETSTHITTPLNSPSETENTSISSIYNTFDEMYNIELQENLHGIRQVIQQQDKCCANSGVVDNASAPPLMACQRILDTTDLPPLTTSFHMLYHSALKFPNNSPTTNAFDVSAKQIQQLRITSDFFLTNVVGFIDFMIYNMFSRSGVINTTPAQFTSYLSHQTPLKYVFGYLQQNLYFKQQQQIAYLLTSLQERLGITGAGMGGADEMAALMEADNNQENDSISPFSANISKVSQNDDTDDQADVIYNKYFELMDQSTIDLWYDIYVDELDVVQVDPFVFNLPHHSVLNTKFYVKGADYELMTTLLSRNTPTQMVEQTVSPPNDENIIGLLKSTDYYARYIQYYRYRLSLLPPHKQISVLRQQQHYGNLLCDGDFSQNFDDHLILSYYTPSVYVQCSSGFCNIVRLDYAFSLGCGHWFCQDCWIAGLQSTLDEKQREATLIMCLGGEYNPENDRYNESYNNQLSKLIDQEAIHEQTESDSASPLIHRMSQYSIKGKCKTTVPMSFLSKIITTKLQQQHGLEQQLDMYLEIYNGYQLLIQNNQQFISTLNQMVAQNNEKKQKLDLNTLPTLPPEPITASQCTDLEQSLLIPTLSVNSSQLDSPKDKPTLLSQQNSALSQCLSLHRPSSSVVAGSVTNNSILLPIALQPTPSLVVKHQLERLHENILSPSYNNQGGDMNLPLQPSMVPQTSLTQTRSLLNTRVLSALSQPQLHAASSLSLLHHSLNVSKNLSAKSSVVTNNNAGNSSQICRPGNTFSFEVNQSLSPSSYQQPARALQIPSYKPTLSPSVQYNKLLWWILDVYVGKNSKIKWCANPHCDSRKMIWHKSNERFDQSNEPLEKEEHLSAEDKTPYAILSTTQCTTLHVECRCLYQQCFKCGEPSHVPAPCDLFKKWDDMMKGGSTDLYIAAHSRPCPKCKVKIIKDRHCSHMTCTMCHHEFCWLCLKNWKTHSGSHYSCNAWNEQARKNQFGELELGIQNNVQMLTKYDYYAERFNHHQFGIEYCLYLKEVLNQGFQRSSAFILSAIIRDSTLPEASKAKSPDSNEKATNSPKFQEMGQDENKLVSVRVKTAVAAATATNCINIYNLDSHDLLTRLGADIRHGLNAPLIKSYHQLDGLAIYYTQLEKDDLIAEHKILKETKSIKVVSGLQHIANNPFANISTFLERFDFLYSALDVLMQARHTLEYSFVVAYFLKTQNENVLGVKTKSKKQMFELQLRYLLEPTETLQSYMDKIVDDMVYVFHHKKVIIDLCGVIRNIRHFLLQQVESGFFDDSLMYQADQEMSKDVWICLCKVERPVSLKVCSTCQACRIHLEPDCNVCSRNF